MIGMLIGSFMTSAGIVGCTDSALSVHGFPCQQRGWVIMMMTELRTIFFLLVSFVFFWIIIGVLGLSTFMKPDRWSERPRSAGE
jgi:hypothetical protein